MKRVSALLGLSLLAAVVHAGDRHLGVASCASTLCHGSAKPSDAHHVQQNEYVTWSRFDPHARAYLTLLEPRSVQMAQRLGIGPAHESSVCLDCHAENVPASQRGPRFQLSDGIGCESCHGASDRWIASHDDAPGVTHADNLTKGLYPIERSEARATLCQACHIGDDRRFAGHRLMAAGHPRLSFELDTFTELWRTSGGREHFRRDADYVARKPPEDGVRAWLTGLVSGTRSQLALLRGPHFQKSGVLPEFAMYNCYSCHRGMKFPQGGGRGLAAGLEPGALRLDDSRLVMLSAVFAAMDSPDARTLREETAALHRAAAASREAVAASSASLDALLAKHAALGERPLAVAQKKEILRQLVKAAGRGDYPDYAGAEQAAMAIVLLLAETGRDRALEPEIEAMFAALKEDDRYDAARFQRVLERIKE
jgi:hypothetical protein